MAMIYYWMSAMKAKKIKNVMYNVQESSVFFGTNLSCLSCLWTNGSTVDDRVLNL